MGCAKAFCGNSGQARAAFKDTENGECTVGIGSCAITRTCLQIRMQFLCLDSLNVKSESYLSHKPGLKLLCAEVCLITFVSFATF